MESSFSSGDIQKLYVQLQSGESGISRKEAAQRLAIQRKNTLVQSRFRRELQLFLRQFTNPLVLLLLVAVVLSALLSETSDAIIIFVILLITGLLGFLQEVHAGRALEKMQHMIQTKASVLRDGTEVEVSANEVVPGDMLILNAGDMIPADCRILESNELHVNESTITGESFPVEKTSGNVPDDMPLSKKENCLWQGTNVISGTARALAVHTGQDTVFGQMAHSLSQVPETSFEKGTKRFGFFLLRITIILSLVILTVNLYFHKPFFDSILFSLALAVGMAPELLPAIMMFAMTSGARRMMQQKVIVKKLSSIFSFGEVNVLCTDKTGTITEGNVVVKQVLNAQSNPDPQLSLLAYLNATFQNGFTNPIDQAIAALNLSTAGYRKVNEIPYDFIRKRLSVAVEKEGEHFFITKGAFMSVLEVCSHVASGAGDNMHLDAEIWRRIEQQFITYSQQGYRVLGLASKKITSDKINRADETDMLFLGSVLLEDPLKASAAASIQQLEKLHVDVKIITGDNRFVANEIARQIGLVNPVILTGDDLNTLAPEALVVKAMQTNIFAEIEPHQKERIIKALQKSKLSVAYIGDGINDVAAINAADIGLSTNNAVDVAKEAADLVLLEKDLSVLAAGVYEGRRSFANSIKYVFITTGATFGNMFSVAGASLFLPFLPMLPKQILLTNLLTDFPFLTIASDRVEPEQLARPGKWNMKLIRNFMILFGLHSSIFDFITFYTLYFYFQLRGSAFQTGWFLESVLTELLIVFVVRTHKPLYKSRPGTMLVVTALIAFFITVLLPVSPFAPYLNLTIAHVQQAVALFVIVLCYVVTADLLKTIFFRWVKE
jgi:P-type Mg2+ transporter